MNKAFRVCINGVDELFVFAESAKQCRIKLMTEMRVNQFDILICCRCRELDGLENIPCGLLKRNVERL